MTARLVAAWALIAGTAAIAPRPTPPDPWRSATSAGTRWESGRADAGIIAWSAGSSTAAACEAMRAARSRTTSELSTAAPPSRDGDLAVVWFSTAARTSAGPTRLITSRWSSAAPRAPPA